MEKLSRILWSLLALFFITSCVDPIDPEPEPEPDPVPEVPPVLVHTAPENTEFRKIAYFPYYRDFTKKSIPDSVYQMLDIACYAFAAYTEEGVAKLKAGTSDISVLVSRCKANNVEVVLSYNVPSELRADYKEMLQSAERRAKFVKSLKEIVDKYNLAGVDNDMEYPSKGDGSHLGNLYLMTDLSNWLHDPKVNKYLTMSITSGKYPGNIRDGIVDELLPCVDWLNIMIYDDYSESKPGINHSSMEFYHVCFNYWVNVRKFPKNKLTIGMPCYGRPSGLEQSGRVLGFEDIIKQGGNPDENEATVTSSKYPDSPFKIYYNGRPIIREKVNHALDNEMGGYFFWEAGDDYCTTDASLIRTAYKEYEKRQNSN